MARAARRPRRRRPTASVPIAAARGGSIRAMTTTCSRKSSTNGLPAPPANAISSENAARSSASCSGSARVRDPRRLRQSPQRQQVHRGQRGQHREHRYQRERHAERRRAGDGDGLPAERAVAQPGEFGQPEAQFRVGSRLGRRVRRDRRRRQTVFPRQRRGACELRRRRRRRLRRRRSAAGGEECGRSSHCAPPSPGCGSASLCDRLSRTRRRRGLTRIKPSRRDRVGAPRGGRACLAGRYIRRPRTASAAPAGCPDPGGGFSRIV